MYRCDISVRGMADLNPTSYVVLGMLRLGLRSGYDIKQLVDKSTRFFWAASYGQIYPELKRLEEAGLIRGEADPQGGRQRWAYQLTKEGEAALDDWLADADIPLTEMRDLGLLKLFFADGVAAGDAAALEQLDPPEGMTRTVRNFGLDFHRWCAERFAQMEHDLLEDK